MLANPTAIDASAENSLADAIGACEPFRELQTPILEAMSHAASGRRYAAGETVFAMGQYDGSEFILVKEGRIKASHVDPKTGSMIFEEIGAGETFGLARAIAGGEAASDHGVSVAAERESEIIAIDAEVFRDLAAQRPTLTRALMTHLAKCALGGGRAAEESSPDRRVYAALAAFIERDAVTAQWRIARMPKHRELADRANVEEADAAGAVARLIQSGVARRDYPGLIIDDMVQLNRLAR